MTSLDNEHEQKMSKMELSSRNNKKRRLRRRFIEGGHAKSWCDRARCKGYGKMEPDDPL